MKKLTTAFCALLVSTAGLFAAADVNVLTTASWAVYTDEIGSKGTVDTTGGKVTAAITRVKESATDKYDNYATLDAGLEADLHGVTAIEVEWEAVDADFRMTLAVNDTVAYGAKLAKGTGKTKFEIKDLARRDWMKNTELDLSKIMGVGFEFEDEDAAKEFTGTLIIKSLTLFNYSNEFVRGDSEDLITSGKFGFHSYPDSLLCVSTEKSVEITLKRDDKGESTGAGIWGPDGFKLKDLVSMDFTYTSDADILIMFDDYSMTLEKGENKTVNLNIGNFKSDVSVDVVDPSSFDSFDLGLADGADNAKITFTAAKLNFTGEVSTKEVKSVKAIAASASISSRAMNLTVPAAGSYKVSVFAANGRLLKTVDTKLAAGANSVAFDGSSLTGKMVIVKVAGNGQTFSTKAIVR